MHGASNIWGCQLNAPKYRTYMPLKKIRGVEHMGCWGHQDGVQMHGGTQTYGGYPDAPKHIGFSSQCLERSDFEQFLLWEGVVVMKELILNSFYFGTVWW